MIPAATASSPRALPAFFNSSGLNDEAQIPSLGKAVPVRLPETPLGPFSSRVAGLFPLSTKTVLC